MEWLKDNEEKIEKIKKRLRKSLYKTLAKEGYTHIVLLGEEGSSEENEIVAVSNFKNVKFKVEYFEFDFCCLVKVGHCTKAWYEGYDNSGILKFDYFLSGLLEDDLTRLGDIIPL